MMRSMKLFWWLLPFLGLAPQGREDAATLLGRVIDAQEAYQASQRELTFRQRTLTQNLAKDGTISRSKSETLVVTPTPGGEYRRLVAKNGRPLSPPEEAKEQEKLEEHIEEQLRLSDEERRKRANEKLESRVERYRERLEQALGVFDFEPLPDETIDGESLRVFRFAPKRGYVGHSRTTKILARMEGVVWIDAERDQLAKLSVVFTRDLKFLGGIFGRVSKGTTAVVEGTLFDGLWVLESIDVNLDARLYFLKRYRQKIAVRYGDYRKYSIDTDFTFATTPESSQR